MAVPVPGTLLAFDDTDSPGGMCTTYLAALLVEEFSELDLIGPPRLVRLNPNIPWKTRGNAAICLSFGAGSGRPQLCGEVATGPVECYPRGSPTDPAELLERASRVLERVAEFGCDKTHPGIVASNMRPSPSFYWRAVREIVTLEDAEAVLSRAGASWRKYKDGRGVIGAAAAMSWRPRDRTWEVIAYRHPSLFGTKRDIDPESVKEMDRITRFTFNNYDYENAHIAISPGSPCPILFGIRGDSPEELLVARTMIRGEAQHKWLLFLTNQATEDHIVPRRIRALHPRQSAEIRARVVARPVTLPGGHVLLRVSDGKEVADEIDALFYEPSRSFRDIARALVPGDEVTLLGSVREQPRSLNVEKLCVRRLVPDVRKVRNPVCPSCRKGMGSMGTGKGYRCKRCGMRAAPSAAIYERAERAVAPGWYEPPVASRRHLHKPIRRMSKADIDNL